VPINTYDQRTEICYGSVGEVKRFEEYMVSGHRSGCGLGMTLA
jgi:hypothetical protein